MASHIQSGESGSGKPPSRRIGLSKVPNPFVVSRSTACALGVKAKLCWRSRGTARPPPLGATPVENRRRRSRHLGVGAHRFVYTACQRRRASNYWTNTAEAVIAAAGSRGRRRGYRHERSKLAASCICANERSFVPPSPDALHWRRLVFRFGPSCEVTLPD